MDIKKKLAKRLLEDTSCKSFFLQNYRLAAYLDLNTSDIELYLNELVNKNILAEKIQYECHICGERIVLNSLKLESSIKQKKQLICPRCYEYLDDILNRTGSIYYEVLDKYSLNKWAE